MSGLPPSLPSNSKINIRSKTTSFKRPFSCDNNRIAKEDQKGLFFNLRKGSSNSKLHEDINENNLILNEEKIVTRIQGRNFDSDDEDYDLSNEETYVTKIDKLFEDDKKVLNNPALIGYLLKYLISHNIDYNGLLFYLIAHHYKSTVKLKEFIKEAPRFANEIITTFLLEKSILKCAHEVNISEILEDLKSNNNLLNIFNKSSTEIFRYNIKEKIDKIRQSIKHGLFTLEVAVETLTFDSQIIFFNECIKYILKVLENKFPCASSITLTKETKEKVQYLSEIVLGVKTSLATLFYYFLKKDRDDNADNVSLVSNKHLRSSFMGKSTENLQMMSNCMLDKHPMFCSKMHKKISTHSFFKKGKSTKGHNFQEKIFEYPMICLYCEKLLWGTNPQGLYCSNCQQSVHKGCKDFVNTNCHKNIKSLQTNPFKMPYTEDYSIKSNVSEEKNSITFSQIGLQNTNDKNVQDTKDIFENEVDQISVKYIDSIIPFEINGSTTISVTNDNDGSSINQEVESIDNNSGNDPHNYSKLDIELKIDFQDEEKSHVRNIAYKYDEKNIPKSQSDENLENKNTPKFSKVSSELVNIPDLVNDLTSWINDAEMNVEETFDANKELESFPSYVAKESDKAEYTRLLVLMEFHHKIKFTIMTLKRFDYLLIKQWPDDDKILFKTLSLNCIIPLYELIKTLNSIIEKCKNETSYTADIAQNVITWFISNNEANLKEWLKYSIDLCCTNSLTLVKNTWKEFFKTDLRFLNVLNKRHKKLIMVEQLANMRPLLFNMPLIVSKIFKDLNKFSKFKNESKIWKEIHEKFKKLPAFIDEHCMPLVQLINNGTIVNSLDRNNWFMRLNLNDPCYDYIMDFPKTAFHFKLFDFQEIKISNFRESGYKNKTPAIFIRDECDAYAICYEKMLVLLQKENDKFYLKQFKATDTSKLNPILILENVHASKGENKEVNNFLLTLVFINVAVLTQIVFTKKDDFLRWHDFICKRKSKKLKNKIGLEACENNVDKYSEIKVIFHEFETSHESFFTKDVKLAKIEKELLFKNPNDSREFFIGTTFDTLTILKNCFENLSASFNDDVIDIISASLTNMEMRLSNYKNLQIKDIISTDDILCEIPEIQKDEMFDIIQDINPSQYFALSREDLEINYDFQSPIKMQSDIEFIGNENDSDSINQDQHILSFVENYIRQIIEDAQQRIQDIEAYEMNNNQAISSILS